MDAEDATLHRLSEGRFMPGIGPGGSSVYRAFGLPPVTTAQMRDWAQLVRRLTSGEVIRDHSGPAARYPLLRIDSTPAAVPLGIVAFHHADPHRPGSTELVPATRTEPGCPWSLRRELG